MEAYDGGNGNGLGSSNGDGAGAGIHGRLGGPDPVAVVYRFHDFEAIDEDAVGLGVDEGMNNINTTEARATPSPSNTFTIGFRNMFFDYLVEKRRVLRAIHGGPECLVKNARKDELLFVHDSQDRAPTPGPGMDGRGTAEQRQHPHQVQVTSQQQQQHFTVPSMVPGPYVTSVPSGAVTSYRTKAQ